MEYRRRQIFSAHASAFGGHIIRPKDIVLEAPSASALTVVGGRSVGRIPATEFGDFFKIRSASTFAEGLFDDRKAFLALTNHQVEEQTLTATTRVRAEVNGLVIGDEPRLTIRKLRAALTGTTPLGSGQPSIRVDQDVVIEGVAIDKYRLIVELQPTTFQRLDTQAKLLVAADDPAFLTSGGDAVFLRTPIDGQPAPPRTGRLIESSNGTIYATVVKSIKWDGKPFPDSEIDGNIVIVPEFGRIYFGELLISTHTRSLTMVRVTLGSHVGGYAAAGGVEDNIIWGY
jgi:hypothetical protein